MQKKEITQLGTRKRITIQQVRRKKEKDMQFWSEVNERNRTYKRVMKFHLQMLTLRLEKLQRNSPTRLLRRFRRGSFWNE